MFNIHVGHKKQEPCDAFPFGSHILTENEPVQIVETGEQAKEAMRQLIAQGVNRGEIYATGFEPRKI
jgi:hypothetical protein